MNKSISLTTLMMIILSLSSFGDQSDKATYAVEIDPATFALGGYSLHLRYSPTGWDHLLFGLGIYAMDMPDLFIDMNENNKDKGFSQRIELGLGLFTEYHFNSINDGWLVGLQISKQDFSISIENSNEEAKYTNALFMGYFGYTWRPIDGSGLYLKPWAGLGYTSKISGENIVDNQEFDIAPLIPFMTLHIGYDF